MSDELSFLAGGGEAARMIRERDWSSHPLGPPQTWPEDLRVALSLILNSPESMILAWGPDLHFFFNETYFPLLGPRVAWAMGERFDKVWADGWDQAKPIIDDAMAGRPKRFVDLPWRLETDRGPADGWWTFSYSRVLAADGAIAGLFILTNETTDKVLSDAALRESETRFRNMADHAPVMMWVTDPEGRCTYLNASWYAFTGQTPETMDGFSWLDAVHPDDRGWSGETFLAANARREPFSLEYRIRAADGTYRWAIDAATPRFNDEGEFLGYIGSVVDISARKAAEAALQRQNSVLETQVEARTRERDRVWHATTDLMGTVGFDGFLKSINPAWPRMLGWSEAELLAHPYAELVDPADHAAMADIVRRLRAGEEIAEFVDTLRGRDGIEHVIMWSATPEIAAGVFHVVGRDVTDQRRMEEQLRQSLKMEAVGQLTGGLAHDFNNLLAGISGSLELLQARLAQGRTGDTERYLNAAQGAAKRAAALTHRLLAFSRRQTLDPKPIDIDALVAGMDDLVRRTMGPQIRVETQPGEAVWPVRVDANQLENALLNLCINARDAMPDGGRLTITTDNRTLDEREAQARDLTPGDYVAMCVADTGTGMSPEVVRRAMEPFFTTKPIGVGTGLGLSMIYGFTRQSDGHVAIDSALGRGTTICLFLPRHRGEVGTADAAVAGPAPMATAGGETVLVIDDEPLVRMLVVDVLEELGYTAIEAGDGPSGMKIIQSDTRIDLLVTDVGLPNGMNGRQVADAARVLRPDLKILFVTGYAENAVLNNGHLDAGMQVLTKPFNMDDLARRIITIVSNP
ncbi:hybrid sensor histidine kinase/response regulator [Aureimonas pseudogalii]|uniref:histidine kinase n=1 Tax=Aureimonas pseudogalii TaxID=1744844 RepID=A0A7W6H6H4_9HYPH|nr:PAS domain-containing hybrid sensor histidine kinase/response regulator [Aureimonas pseudogalii]MBB3999368.1 PAS domain S-box-containing protein [Aureimonas pseudogalii]